MWTIHFIHYALFPKVGAEEFVAFEKAHVDRIGNLLLLPWLTEGVTLLGILALAFLGSRRDLRLPALINSAAMGVVLVIKSNVNWMRAGVRPTSRPFSVSSAPGGVEVTSISRRTQPAAAIAASAAQQAAVRRPWCMRRV